MFFELLLSRSCLLSYVGDDRASSLCDITCVRMGSVTFVAVIAAPFRAPVLLKRAFVVITDTFLVKVRTAPVRFPQLRIL